MRINLPQIDKIVNNPCFEGKITPIIKRLAKETIAQEREKALSLLPYKNEDEIIDEIHKLYEQTLCMKTKPLINATGVILHTNLGRSPISKEILRRAEELITSYTNLEFDLKSGTRGDRHSLSSFLLRELSGFEDALIVNNNASSVFLILNTFANNKEVIISRGELVEIGGNFRVPEVMSLSGAILREVGTTNKTYTSDYERAIDQNSAMIMKVHQSNFSTFGFTAQTSQDELATLAKQRDLISYYDIGSAYITPLPHNLGALEPPLKDSMVCDLVSFSADKLFSSVQCGIILGKKELIAKLKKNQLFRMLRVDKVTLAILNETLKAYLNGELELITTLVQLNLTKQELQSRARALKNSLKSGVCEVIDTKTFVGGGTLPNKSYPSTALAFFGDCKELELKFRDQGVIGRIEEDKFLLDFRSILQKDLAKLTNITQKIFE